MTNELPIELQTEETLALGERVGRGERVELVSRRTPMLIAAALAGLMALLSLMLVSWGTNDCVGCEVWPDPVLSVVGIIGFLFFGAAVAGLIYLAIRHRRRLVVDREGFRFEAQTGDTWKTMREVSWANVTDIGLWGMNGTNLVAVQLDPATFAAWEASLSGAARAKFRADAKFLGGNAAYIPKYYGEDPNQVMYVFRQAYSPTSNHDAAS